METIQGLIALVLFLIKGENMEQSNQLLNDLTIDEMLKSFNYMLEQALKNSTKIFRGIILSSNADGTWNIQYNGEVHAVRPNRAANPSVNSMVDVFVPQGNQALAFFI